MLSCGVKHTLHGVSSSTGSSARSAAATITVDVVLSPHFDSSPLLSRHTRDACTHGGLEWEENTLCVVLVCVVRNNRHVAAADSAGHQLMWLVALCGTPMLHCVDKLCCCCASGAFTVALTTSAVVSSMPCFAAASQVLQLMLFHVQRWMVPVCLVPMTCVCAAHCLC